MCRQNSSCLLNSEVFRPNHHHHHHVPGGLGVFPVPWSSRWSWSLHLFLGRPMFLCPFGLYCSACFGSLSLPILCTCCSHFFWYCFISFTTFCAPVFCLIHWSFLFLVLLFQVRVSKISYVLLLNVVPLFSSVPSFNSKFQCCFSCNVVAAPPLDAPCDGPVTYPGDTKILVKSSKGRSGPTLKFRPMIGNSQAHNNSEKNHKDHRSKQCRSFWYTNSAL